jgi:opacity protein-like surface antigen
MFKKIAIAASLAILSSAAMAADQPYFYAGGDLGSTKVEGADRETSFGGFAGYQFNENFALEAGIRRLGKAEFGSADIKVNQYSLSGVGTIPLSNGFSVFGRLGYNRVDVKASAFGVSDSDHDDEVLYGVGVGYKFSETISGRVEVQKPHSDITNVSVGVAFRF